MHKRPQLTLAILVTLVLATRAAQTDSPILLKMRYGEGDVIRQRMTMDQSIKQTVMGQPQSTSQTIAMGYTQKVTDVDPGGVASVEFTYDMIKFELQNPAIGVISFDSSEQDAEKPSNPVVHAYAALVGRTLSMKIDPDGEVTELEGMDAIIKSIGEGLSVPPGPQRDQMMEQLKEQFGSTQIKDMMQQAAKTFPDTPVDTGDTWHKTITLDQPFSLVMETTYRVADRQNGVMSIDMTGTIKPNPEAAPIEMGSMTMKSELTGSQTGTMQVVEANGTVRTSAIQQKVSGSLTIAGPPEQGGGMSIPMTIDSTVKTETLK